MGKCIEAERNEARALIHQARAELTLASMRRDIVRTKVALANWRLSQVLAAFRQPLSQHAYNPSQPRVPAGNPDGGQWTGASGEGGSLSGANEVGGAAEPERIEVAADGHHFVPQAFVDSQNFTPETRRIFQDAKTGPLRAGPHYFDHAHRAYSVAVEQHYKAFLAERGWRSHDLTPGQARQVVDSILSSSDPRIRGFNLNLYRREWLYWIRRMRIRE